MSIKSTGKFLSLILRHKPEAAGITMDEHGWVKTDELIKKLPLTMEALEEIVAADGKQRFSFNADKTLIRANQGHSIDVDVELKEAVPLKTLYHGTAEKYLESIEKCGLIPKSRLYVHLSQDTETAIQVGSRHGKPVVYAVDTEKMAADGFKFYLSANKVWLTKSVPFIYLKRL